jgi:prepilin-type N-terminal cleavage/methylation domain-containing protein
LDFSQKSEPNQSLGSDQGLKPVRASKYLSTSVNRNGFTLIEIVVTLCIVAILSAIAIPGFRKVTEDFRLNATLEDTVDILKACRAYYLIFNEFPLDKHAGIPDKLCPFVPSYLINPNRGANNQRTWTHLPLGNTAYIYDLDNFMDLSYKLHSMGVSLYKLKTSTADWKKCYNKFKSCLGEKYITTLISSNDRMFCILPECPGSMDLNSNTLWENRYY